MTKICPKDYTACPDDLCEGGGCMQMGSRYPMIERCDMCGGIIDEELGEYCECGEPDDDDFLELPDFLVGSDRVQPKMCRICGCTDDDCSKCIEKTGQPCHWVKDGLCSACVGQSEPR